MTLSEFKAWFEGFSEGIDTAPTEAQFAKIKAKVALIDGTPVTRTVYLDRYVPNYPWRPYWGDIVGEAQTTGGTLPIMKAYYAAMSPSEKGDSQTVVTFDSHAAMRDLGRAEVMNG